MILYRCFRLKYNTNISSVLSENNLKVYLFKCHLRHLSVEFLLDKLVLSEAEMGMGATLVWDEYLGLLHLLLLFPEHGSHVAGVDLLEADGDHI